MGRSIKKKLIKFKEEASQCRICRDEGLLYQHSNRRWAYPLFDNNLECRSGVMAIAEAPNWKDTFEKGKGYLTYDIPTDNTGNFFRDLLESVELRVQDVVITNSVFCLPAKKGKDYPVSARQQTNCLLWIKRLIDEVDPRVIITLGAKALQAINRIEKHPLTRLRDNTGKIYGWYGRKLLPLFHPGDQGRANQPDEMQKKDISNRWMKRLMP